MEAVKPIELVEKPRIGGRALDWLVGLRHLWEDHPTLVVGGSIVGTICVVALLAPWLTPYDPIKINLAETLLAPSAAHILGTDDLGRDNLARLVFGARISLAVGFVAVGLGLFWGTALGLVSGYWGGHVDNIIMRIMDALLSVPGLVLAIGITAALGQTLNNVIIAIAIVYVPAFARLVRGQVLTLREQEFIKAAQVVGVRTWQIVLRHLLPNALTPIIVLGSLRLSTAILTEASLSFLGIGVRPPTPTWGSMVSLGKPYMETAPWVVFAPGGAIFIAVIGLTLMGEGIRDALDPRLRSQVGGRQ